MLIQTSKLIWLQRYGKSASLKSCCQKRKRSLWRRWRAMDRQSLKKSKCAVISRNRISATHRTVNIISGLYFHPDLVCYQIQINILITYSAVGIVWHSCHWILWSWLRLDGAFPGLSRGVWWCSSQRSGGWATWRHWVVPKPLLHCLCCVFYTPMWISTHYSQKISLDLRFKKSKIQDYQYPIKQWVKCSIVGEQLPQEHIHPTSKIFGLMIVKH